MGVKVIRLPPGPLSWKASLLGTQLLCCEEDLTDHMERPLPAKSQEQKPNACMNRTSDSSSPQPSSPPGAAPHLVEQRWSLLRSVHNPELQNLQGNKWLLYVASLG